MTLLGLPSELLALIVKYLGPTIRASVGYLLVSRQWYLAALPAFLSGLPLSTIYLSSYDLLRLPPARTPLSNLIAEQVVRLSIRLVGHPSRQRALNPWNKCGKADEDDSDVGSSEKSAGWDYWMSVGPAVDTSVKGGGKRYMWHTEEHQLGPWRHHVNERLVELAGILPDFRSLKELSFEASSEQDDALGPRWDYLFGSTVEKFIQALPTGLESLTLDICGSALVKSKTDRTPVHLCSLVAVRLQDFEDVRLRLRHICPQVFDNSTNLSGDPSKLSSLVIRLNLPFFPEVSYTKYDRDHGYDAQQCPSSSIVVSPLHNPMITAGTLYAKTMKLDRMRITYRSPEESGFNLYVADCVRRRYLCEPSGIFSYEDDGRQWEAWEDHDGSLQVMSRF